ncbi:MAG: hypothetical protein QOE01_822 [Actinomycetota bacterium]|jgi:hypothetical protein|nr:hypothetical protein [Actinomycetota bacterium]MDQ1617242.1 hypothetical protein [Actinomycetota bacterium]
MNHARAIAIMALDDACWMELDSAAAYAGVTVTDLRLAIVGEQLHAVVGHPLHPGRRLLHRREVERWAGENRLAG